MKKLNLKRFARRYQLYRNQPWISDHERAFESLLSESNSRTEDALIFSLLNRYNYLNNSDYIHAIEKIAEHIVNTWLLNEIDTQLACLTSERKSKSAHRVLYDLNVKISAYGWYHPNTSTHNEEIIKKADSCPNIILVDEFIGSGETAIVDSRRLKNQLLDELGISNPNIKICAIAGMREGINLVEAEDLDVHVIHILEKGISSFYKGASLVASIRDMNLLEANLAAQIEAYRLLTYSFGYTKSEALYGREDGNVVDNVFPIFWWRQSSNGNFRKTFFRRTG